MWAEAGWEPHEPWLEYHASGGLVPFGQIHGHLAVVRYTDQTWRTPGRVRQRATVGWTGRRNRVRIGGWTALSEATAGSAASTTADRASGKQRPT